MDLVRAAEGIDMNGSPMDFVTLVVDTTADWPAWLFLTAQRYWNHAKHPCPKCDVKLKNMCVVHDIGTCGDTDPWDLITKERHAEILAASQLAFHLS